MIAIRLLLLVLSLYGLTRLSMRRLRLPAEGALPLTMVSVSVLVTLAGMLNLLREAVWLLWAAGLALAVHSLWRRESLRDVVTPGICFFVAGAVGPGPADERRARFGIRRFQPLGAAGADHPYARRAAHPSGTPPLPF